jgi:hypothetical protein
MNDGCWIWPRSKTPKGYGTLRSQAAHRVVYEAVFGPIPKGHDLHHECENPSCVNPFHLVPVTHRENLLRGDTIVGRQARQTQCSRGHQFDVANTYYTKDGKRRCRTCDRNRARERHRRLAAQKG